MSIFDIMKGYTESLYDSTCSITEYQEADGNINNVSPMTIAKNIPCRLSYKSITNTSEGDTASMSGQSIKLFLQPDITVKAGSSIAVSHRGVKRIFKASGEPAVYVSHQEIELISEREYA